MPRFLSLAAWSRFPLAAQFALVAATVLALLWGVVLADLRGFERHEVADTRADLARISEIGAQALLSAVRTTDLLLLNLRDHWRLNRAEFDAIVRRRQLQAEVGGVFNITVTDAAGRVVYASSNPDTVGVSLADREHFQVARTSDDRLIIAAPMQARLDPSQGWLLGFVRPLQNEAGAFAGMIAATFSAAYLLRIFEPIDLGEGVSVTVFRDDARLLLRSSVRGIAGTDLPSRLRIDYPLEASDSQPIVASRFFAVASSDSFVRYRSPFDGIERLFWSKPVGIYPLRLTVGRSLQTIEAASALYRRRYLVGGVVASVLALFGIYWGLVTQRTRAAARAQRLQDIARLRESEARLKASERSLRELSSRQMALKEAERKRVAQEVHDEIGQRLTVLRMELSMLPRAVAPDPARLLPQRVDALKRDVDEALTIARDIAGRLRPAALDLGLGMAAEGLVEEFQHCLEVPCTFENRLPAHFALDETRATAAFRILQEALTNAARHADAQRIDVRLEQVDDELRIAVADNGRGFVTPAEGQGGSLGLSGMRERAGALGGQVKLSSRPGVGTEILARIPLSRPIGSSSLIPVNHDPLATVHSE